MGLSANFSMRTRTKAAGKYIRRKPYSKAPRNFLTTRQIAEILAQKHGFNIDRAYLDAVIRKENFRGVKKIPMLGNRQLRAGGKMLIIVPKNALPAIVKRVETKRVYKQKGRKIVEWSALGSTPGIVELRDKLEKANKALSKINEAKEPERWKEAKARVDGIMAEFRRREEEASRREMEKWKAEYI